jgi:chromate reductase
MRILAFAGSLRSGSLNRKLLDVAIRAIGDRAEIDRLDLRELSMPLYDGDLEEREGLPEGARLLKQRVLAADALLIATPEYNHSIPGMLKNAIDWASRPPENPFKGKTALLMGASPGQFGGVRGILALRQVLTALFAHVVPVTVQVARADQAFDEAGGLKEARVRSSVERASDELLRVTSALGGGK